MYKDKRFWVLGIQRAFKQKGLLKDSLKASIYLVIALEADLTFGP
jgi:hypothetical protein